MVPAKRRVPGRSTETDRPVSVDPDFEHGPYTIEGEIERFGAFGRGGAAATGWKRVVALIIAVAMVGPIIIGALVFLVTWARALLD